MKTLGILGGMGPMATACFMERITAMTAADTDQEQIPVIVYSNTQKCVSFRQTAGGKSCDGITADGAFFRRCM